MLAILINLTSKIYNQQALFTNFNTTLFTNLYTSKFWKVGNGDAITLNYCNTKNETKNLFIDGGYPGNYLPTIKKEILEFNTNLEGKDFEKQIAYRFWHLLYSYEGDNSNTGNDKLIEKLHTI